ncbi:hypothetical protein QTP88_009631 [Uroleucon formosanum]
MGVVTVVLARDFRQTLPIVPRGTRANEIAACIKSSYLWPKIEKFSLTKNMRVHLKGDKTAEQFSELLLKIDGKYPKCEEKITLPTGLGAVVNTLQELTYKIYPGIENLKEISMDWLCERVILASKNDTAEEINKILLGSFQVKKMVHRSVNSVLEIDDAVNYPVEFLNSLNPPGFPPHSLTLKIGTPVMLLRNLSPPKLCNRTRLRITDLQKNLIEAQIMTGSTKGESVFIPRIPMIPSDYPFQFKRKQFPVKVFIINWNANGIKKNRNTFAAFLSAHNVDIACVSQTHLIASDKIKFNGYTTYRKDRIAIRPSGGVAIIIKSKIKHQLTYLPATQTLEAVAISITINQSITTIISAYQSPSFQMYINDFEKILNSYQKNILVGDLNCKHTTWYCKSTNANGRKLYKYLASNPAILSAPDTPTYYPYDQSRSPDILDVIILKSIRFSMHQKPLFELNSDHLPVEITLDASLSFSTPTRKLITGKADWQKFKQHITTNLIIPKNILNINSADTAVTHLREIICQAAEVCSEKKNTVINYSPNQLPLNIVKLIKSKHQTRRLWQLYRQRFDRKKLNYLIKEVKRQLEEHRINSYQKYLSAIHLADSNLWTATKRLIKPNSNEIPPLKASGTYLNTDSEKCELFAHTFENTFTLNNSAIENSTDNLVKQKLYEPNIFPQNILPYSCPNEFLDIIKKLPKRKSPGHDLITNAILKNIPRKVITYLAILFNFLIKIEYFPKEWKLATIIMIKKPGKDNTDPRNYRPISLLSSVSKIFGKIIHSKLTNYLNAINAIHTEVHVYKIISGSIIVSVVNVCL